MAGNTVQSLNSAITAITDELTSLKTTITDYHTTLHLPST